MDIIPFLSLEVTSSGLTVTFTGRLVVHDGNTQIPVADKPIRVSYFEANANPPYAGDLDAGLTDSNGYFSANVNVKEKGDYTAAAYFAGDDMFSDAWSGWRRFTVTDVIPPPVCTVDSDCPSGYVCQNGVCVPITPPPASKLPLIVIGLLGLGIIGYFMLKK